MTQQGTERPTPRQLVEKARLRQARAALGDVSIAPKPGNDSEWGYLTHGRKAIPCTRQALEARCRRLPLPQAVWVPEFDGLVLPTAVPWLHDVIEQELGKHRLGPLSWALVVLGVGITAFGVFSPIGWVFGLTAGLILLLGAWVVGHARGSSLRVLLGRFDPEVVRQETEVVRFIDHARDRSAPYMRVLVVVLGIAFAMQHLAGGIDESIARAGLVRQEARAGEWWRLITAAFLHGSVLHFVSNIVALLVFGRYVESIVHGRQILSVFLLSALAGHLASVLLYSDGTSVGASGGLLGLAGCLLALGVRRPDLVPRKLRLGILSAVAMTAAAGLVPLMYRIDNAAHAGGFVCGALLGLWVSVRDPAQSSATHHGD